MGSLCLGLLLFEGVLLDSAEKLLPRSGKIDMLDPNVHSLFEVSVPYALVDDYANCRFGDIVYNAGLPMIDFVGHARRCFQKGFNLKVGVGVTGGIPGDPHPF